MLKTLSTHMACATMMFAAGCNSSSSSGSAAHDTVAANTATPSMCDSFAIAQFAMDTPVAAAFADTFLIAYRYDDAGGRFTAGAASLSIPKDLMLKFEELAPGLDPTTQCLGVRIAYGLDENAQPVFLFGPVPMTHIPSAGRLLDFRLEDPLGWYSPVGGYWQSMPPDTAQAAMERYAVRMRKYIDGTLQSLRIDSSLGNASDPSSTFFPFTEFRALIRENEEILQDVFKDRNDIPSITAVRLRWAAETAGDNGTLKQIVVMIPVLDGPSYPRRELPLTLKAADLNERCPPSCANGIVSYARVTAR